MTAGMPGNNNLEDLPPEITQLQALKDLDAVNNNLRFLPAEMATITSTPREPMVPRPRQNRSSR